MRRWLAVSLALVIAAGAIYALATTRAGPPFASPHSDIDEASRQRLEAILREENP